MNELSDTFKYANPVLIAIALGLLIGFACILAAEPLLSTIFIFNIFNLKFWMHLGAGIQITAAIGLLCLISAYIVAGRTTKKSTQILAAIAAVIVTLLLYFLLTFFTVMSAVS